MRDPREPRRDGGERAEPRHTVADVAAVVGGRIVGDGSAPLTGVATLDDAKGSELSFLHREDYRARAEASAAGCVLVPSDDALPGRCVIVVDEPQRALVAALELFHPRVAVPAGVAPGAHVADDAEVAESASIATGAVVGAGAVIGARSRVGEGAIVGPGVTVGADCELHPGALVLWGCELGDRVVIQAGAVIGADGFGYASSAGGHVRIPHVGGVVLEDDVEIGAGSCVDRAVLGDTRIGRGTKIDNLVQVAHNVIIGERCLLVAQSGVAGSSRLGDGVVLAGQAGIAGHLAVGANARIAAKSAALQDVAENESVAGIPATPLAGWRRQVAALRRLPDLVRRVRRLEDRENKGDERE